MYKLAEYNKRCCVDSLSLTVVADMQVLPMLPVQSQTHLNVLPKSASMAISAAQG